MKIQFKQQPLPKFGLIMASEYLLLSQKAVKMQVPFATAYSCEIAFSAITNMMTKYRSRLVQSEMHIALTKILLTINNLC